MVTFDHDDPLADTRTLTGESADAAGDVAAGGETGFGGSFSLSIAFDRATCPSAQDGRRIGVTQHSCGH